MKPIVLKGGLTALVDDDSFEHLSEFSWTLRPDGYVNGTKALSSGRYLVVLMHAEVAHINSINSMVDHKNGNRRDNQLGNLRPCTKSTNGANRGPNKNNKSGFKGVCLHRPSGLWRAEVFKDGRRVFTRYFCDKVDAARAYNEAAVEHFGEFAYVNPV